MKLWVEFNLNPNDEAHDIHELCVDIRNRIEGYLVSRELSWDTVKVGELGTQAILSFYEELPN